MGHVCIKNGAREQLIGEDAARKSYGETLIDQAVKVRGLGIPTISIDTLPPKAVVGVGGEEKKPEPKPVSVIIEAKAPKKALKKKK